VTKQTSISEDKVTVRGKTYSVYFVVKNSPFQIAVGLKNCNMSLKQLAFDMTLIYDIPDYNKEVAYVSTKPVDYKPSINDAGDEISFDAKISALSSQHEDSFFRLKITVWDPTPSSPYSTPITALSHPIKVISKPINQRKNKKSDTVTRRRSSKNSASSPVDKTKESQTSCLSSCEATDRLEKLQAQQQQTLHLLHQVLSRTFPPDLPSSSSTTFSSPEDQDQEVFRPAKRIKQEKSQNHFPPMYQNSRRPHIEDFENIFFTMLQAYSLMSSQDKESVIGRLLQGLTHQDNQQLDELFDNIRAGGTVDHYLASFPYNNGFLAPSENLAMPFIPEDIYES